MIKIGLIGYGYWGPNLARNLSDVEGARLVSCCDLNKERLDLVERKHPGVRVLSESSALIDDEEVDAVVVATPIGTHLKLAREALVAGKHVLIEKPMATSSAEADELNALADEINRVLMVDLPSSIPGLFRRSKRSLTRGNWVRSITLTLYASTLGCFNMTTT